MDHNKEVMTPTEFVLWLNGATSMVDGPPSAEQWAIMQEKLHPIIAKMMADKLMGSAEELQMHKTHKEQIERIQKEMQQKHNFEIKAIKQRAMRGDWGNPYGWPTPQDPLGQNVHRSGQMSLHTGAVSISPNTAWLSNVPPG